MISENAAYSKFYPGMSQQVYAPKWYYPKHVKSDARSYSLWGEAKQKDLSSRFWPDLKELIDELKRKDIIKKDIQLITTIPASKIEKYNPTLSALGQKMSDYLNIPFENILQRIKEGKKSGKILTHQERFELISDSLRLSRKINESKIALLDDTKTTGMSILESKKILNKAGCKEIIALCLGINSNWDRD